MVIRSEHLSIILNRGRGGLTESLLPLNSFRISENNLHGVILSDAFYRNSTAHFPILHLVEYGDPDKGCIRQGQ